MKYRLQRSTEMDSETHDIQLTSYHSYRHQNNNADVSNINGWPVTRRDSTDGATTTNSPAKETGGAKMANVDSGDGLWDDSHGGWGSGAEKYVHCALLGDGMVGKTCLTLSYTQQLFTDRYTATVFDNYPVPVSIEGEEFIIRLSDTAGQSDYESLRTSTYCSSEVLVLCFSVVDRESFYSVLHSWLPEIQRHTKGKRPLLLVGTQIDLRKSSSSSSSVSSPSSSVDLGASSLKAKRAYSFFSDKKTPSLTSSSSCRTSRLNQEPLRQLSISSKDIATASMDIRAFSKGMSSSKGRRSSCDKSLTRTTSKDISISSEGSRMPTMSSSGQLKASSKDRPSSLNKIASTLRRKSTSDLRTACSIASPVLQTEQGEVSWEEGSQLARMISADCYIECSARSQEGVREVFQHVVFSALKYRKKRSSLLFRLFSR